MVESKKYAIKKTYKCRTIGTTGVLFDSKEKADKICEALNEAKNKFSEHLKYTVIEI